LMSLTIYVLFLLASFGEYICLVVFHLLPSTDCNCNSSQLHTCPTQVEFMHPNRQSATMQPTGTPNSQPLFLHEKNRCQIECSKAKPSELSYSQSFPHQQRRTSQRSSISSSSYYHFIAPACSVTNPSQGNVRSYMGAIKRQVLLLCRGSSDWYPRD